MTTWSFHGFIQFVDREIRWWPWWTGANNPVYAMSGQARGSFALQKKWWQGRREPTRFTLSVQIWHGLEHLVAMACGLLKHSTNFRLPGSIKSGLHGFLCCVKLPCHPPRQGDRATCESWPCFEFLGLNTYFQRILTCRKLGKGSNLTSIFFRVETTN